MNKKLEENSRTPIWIRAVAGKRNFDFHVKNKLLNIAFSNRKIKFKTGTKIKFYFLHVYFFRNPNPFTKIMRVSNAAVHCTVFYAF